MEAVNATITTWASNTNMKHETGVFVLDIDRNRHKTIHLAVLGSPSLKCHSIHFPFRLDTSWKI